MNSISVAPDRGNPCSTSNPLLEAALEYARRGWRVFPLHTPTPQGCSCGKVHCASAGKHPRTSNGLTGASKVPSNIREWWTKWPDANIGIATGSGSGIFVLDVDGVAAQSSLRSLGELPPTLRANTGRIGEQGGRTGFHLYFAIPVGVNLRSKNGFLGKGLDIKAAGGYVVASPSLHSSGLKYEWANAMSILDAPDWLIQKASEVIGSTAPTPENHFIVEGERNDRLFRLAAKWRRQGASKDELVSLLRPKNHSLCKPPLEDDEVLRIASSAVTCVEVGSLDPLALAWEKAKAEGDLYCYGKLLALIRHLASGPGCIILLPVERIGALFGCDWTLIRRHRRKAIADGYIDEVEAYKPHQKATRFMVQRLPECPTNRVSHES